MSAATVTPVQADLSGYTAAALVDAVIQLTHRIHSETDGRARGAVLAAYREQRELATAELIRRCPA